MTAQLPEKVKAWFDSAEYATIATIEPNGRPQLSVVWVARDGDDILVSTTEGRRKHSNMVRDPRATILLWPKESPYTYVEVRGTVTMTTEGGRELIDSLAKKYMGKDRYTMDDGTDNVRVTIRITPDKVIAPR
jgi:PPOX class probable F420-dependent enzyme